MFSCITPAFANSSVTPSNFIPYLQTNSGYYWYNSSGTTSTVTSGTKLTDILGQLGGNLSYHLYQIYFKVNSITKYIDDLERYVDGIEGYIDGIETTLTNINNKLPASTWFDNIKSYVDGLEGYVDGVENYLSQIENNTDGIEGYIDGIETKLDTLNTSITNNNSTSDISNIKTYTNNIMYSLDGRGNGLYTLISGVTNTKLDLIAQSIGAGSSLDNLQTKTNAVISTLGRIEQDLGYWDNNHARSYDAGEMIFNTMEYTNSIDNQLVDISTILTTEQAISLDRNEILTSEYAISIDRNEILTSEVALSVDRNELLEQFNNDYNNIDWIQSSFNNFYYAKDDINTSVSPSFGTKSGYFVFSTSSYNGLIKISVPITSNSPIESELIFKVGYYYNNIFNEIPDAVICLSSDNLYSEFVINIPFEYAINNVYPYALYFDHKGTNALFYIRAITPYIYTLGNNTIDYYTVNNQLNGFNILRLIRQAKEMFFDDETLAAKKANASQTTTVINNYTGSGKASASASDYADIANSVDSVNAGLNTGVSISNIFNIYNNTDGYSFWSNETKNELNTTNNNRLMKGSNYSDTPLYDAKLNELFSYMGVDKK